MKRFRNILVVADEASLTDAVMQRAEWLALSNDADLTLVDVVDAQPGDLARILSALPGHRAAEVEARVMEAHAQRLEGRAEALREKGVTVMTRVLSGTGFIEIIRQVLRGTHDLVLKGAYRGPDRPFLRAPDLHLLRKCPCPVWILSGETGGKSEHILAAVDPDPDNPVGDGVNHMVMELATSLARNDGARLDVMSAWYVQEESTMRTGYVTMKEEEIQAILTHERDVSAARLATLTEAFDGFSDVMRVLHLKGIAADVIADHAESEDVDTLVMGTLGRTGVAGFFIGNTAETILNRVTCSVLAVKPDGFVSPVRLDG